MSENSPLRAIRKKCLECSSGSFQEVKFCVVTDCELWPFRLGQRPNTARRKQPELFDKESVLATANRDA